jgi:hypothetical protein
MKGCRVGTKPGDNIFFLLLGNKRNQLSPDMGNQRVGGLRSPPWWWVRGGGCRMVVGMYGKWGVGVDGVGKRKKSSVKPI